MLRAAASRIGAALISLIGVSLLSFALLRVVPGDPVGLYLGPLSTAAARRALSAEMGLNKPLWTQYADYVSGLARGNWGYSFSEGVSVRDLLASRLPASLEIGIGALAFTLVFAALLALAKVLARRRWVRAIIDTVTYLGLSLPQFWLALLLLVLFSVDLGVFPGPEGRLSPGLTPPSTITGLYTLDALLEGNFPVFSNAVWHLVLPSLALGLYSMSFLSRVLYANLEVADRQPFVEISLTRGLSRLGAVLRHSLPNALVTSITAAGVLVGVLLTGTVLIEGVFAWPGIGDAVTDSIQKQDFSVVQAFIMLSAVVYIVTSLLVELAVLRLDPRVRDAARRRQAACPRDPRDPAHRYRPGVTVPTRRLLFNGFAQVVPSHLTPHGLWRSPWGREHSFNDLSTWIDIAQTLEAAKFDGLFLADHLGIGGKYDGSYAIHTELGICFPDNDAVVVSSALAAVTTDLALSFTSSLIQNQPFEFARLASTLDHLSQGRVGWNAVTSALENSYRNVGFPAIPTHAERYARADEFLDVVYKLWEGSWADDAVVHDIEHAVYADPKKIFTIDHDGPLYRVQGPHLSEPSPQRTPFIYTAGMSESSHRLAAQHAEGLLISARDPRHAQDVVARVRRYLPEYGRHPDDLKVFQNLKFIVGSTEEEAQRKYQDLLSWAHPAGAAAQAGGVLGVDLGGQDPDQPLSVAEASGLQGVFGAAATESGQTEVTINQILERSNAQPIVGTPEHIADVIEEWQQAGVDGINLADYLFHGSYHDFTEHVTPILQARGVAQREYAEGTFREKVFGDGPYLNDRHPAARYRGAFTQDMV